MPNSSKGLKWREFYGKKKKKGKEKVVYEEKGPLREEGVGCNSSVLESELERKINNGAETRTG